MNKMNISPKVFWLAKVAMLSVLAFLVSLIRFPLPLIPDFLKFDVADVPALLGGFALGPLAGGVIVVVKNLLDIAFTGLSVGGVGQLANAVVGIALVVPAAFVYRKVKRKSVAVMGLGVGVLASMLVAAVTNYFVMIPLYAQMMPLEKIIAMMSKINPAIHGLGTYVLWGVLPFNLIRGLAHMGVALLLYKPLSPVLHAQNIKQGKLEWKKPT